jgi:hypothetical protein
MFGAKIRKIRMPSKSGGAFLVTSLAVPVFFLIFAVENNFIH